MTANEQIFEELEEIDIFKFLMPLALTSFLMMSTHSIINAGLARSPDPSLALASFAIAQSAAFVIDAPIFAIREVSASLIRDYHSFSIVRNTFFVLLIPIFLAFILVGFTPLSRIVFSTFFGVEPDMLQSVIWTYRIFIFIPVVSGIRGLYQGLVIAARKSSLIMMGMVLRVLFMTGVVIVYSFYPIIPGAAMGAMALSGGIGVEALIIYLKSRNFLLFNNSEDSNEFGEESTKKAAATVRNCLSFYLPLGVMGVVGGLIRPFINSGLTRTPDPNISVAAFAVAFGLAWILVSPTFFVHEVVLVLTRDAASFKVIKKFLIKFTLILTLVGAAIAFSPAADWIFVNLIGVESLIHAPAVTSLRYLTPLPVILCFRGVFTGLILKEGNTRVIGVGRFSNLTATAAVFFLFIFIPVNIDGAVIGSLAALSGHGLEAVILWRGAETEFLLKSGEEKNRLEEKKKEVEY